MEEQNQNPNANDATTPPENAPVQPSGVSDAGAAMTPPTPTVTPSPYVAPSAQGYAVQPTQPYAVPPVYAAPAPQTNAWAIVSLVSSILGWLGLFGLGGIIGVVTGLIARNQIKENPAMQTGDGLALTGIILGAVNIIFGCIIAMCIFAVFAGVFSAPFWGRSR